MLIMASKHFDLEWVYGSTAAMARRLTMKGRYKDRDISGQYSYTNVLGRQQPECWRIVASHAAQLAATIHVSTTEFGGLVSQT